MFKALQFSSLSMLLFKALKLLMSTLLVLRVQCPQAKNMDTFLGVTHTDLCCLCLLKTKQPDVLQQFSHFH